MDALDRLSGSISYPGTENVTLQKHFSEFLLQYDDSNVREFGYLRSIIPEVVKGSSMATGQKKGNLGAVMAIQTFGDYARWHPHVHVLLADGLFRENGVFYVMPKIDINPLGELFRANILKMLKKEGRIDDVFIEKIMKWKHNSGFSVHNGVRLSRVRPYCLIINLCPGLCLFAPIIAVETSVFRV